jgi:DNA-binding MarR family transcriptional regulator/GNAT superfamily N-acetyltransferase
MDADADTEVLAQVRRFNRRVTERVGALHDGYLDRGRPLGASRVLWEVGEGGTDLRALRERLHLDSGYLSRIVRRLEADGLVTVAPSPVDKRVRMLRVTAAGRAEQAGLDRDSDALAWSFLAPLDRDRRARLVEAMGTVERLLTAGLVDVRVEEPTTAAARFCIESYLADIGERFEEEFDPALTGTADPEELTLPAGLLLVAFLDGEPVGCGALKLHDDRPADIKRLWVAPAARGLGVGRRLLADLEARAREHGAEVVRLDTNRSLTEAQALYRSAGYVEVPRFNDEPYAHHWFEKRLAPG